MLQMDKEERIIYQEQLRDLAGQLSQAEENERRRVAEGLHDEVGQLLGGLSMHLEVLSGASLLPAQRDSLAEARELLQKASRAVRTLTFQLWPPLLHEAGLGPALKGLVAEFNGKHPIEFDFASGGDMPELADDTRAFIFRAAGELLSNAANHASAKHVHLSLGFKDGDVSLCVEDDGVGFNPAGIVVNGPAGRGFGLFAIRERAGSMCGRLEIDSAPGKGCRAMLVISLVAKMT
jgi:signal transduction histidine kinase